MSDSKPNPRYAENSYNSRYNQEYRIVDTSDNDPLTRNTNTNNNKSQSATSENSKLEPNNISSSQDKNNPQSGNNLNETSPNQFNIFGHKINKSAFYALVFLCLGLIMFFVGLTIVFLNNNDKKENPFANQGAWDRRQQTVPENVMIGITITTVGIFVMVISLAVYCFTKKNKISKHPNLNVQICVPSEIDPHGPQTQFTDVNLDDDDSEMQTEMETTNFGANMDAQKRSLLLKEHNARYNQEIIPQNQNLDRPSAVNFQEQVEKRYE